MTHPERIHCGRLNLNPILAKKPVISSTGHIMHQNRPKNIADRTISGHHSLHTKLVVRFILLSWLMKNSSLVGDEKPIITSPIKAINVSTLNEIGNHLYPSSLFIAFNINRNNLYASHSESSKKQW